jgi:hypothetical protein
MTKARTEANSKTKAVAAVLAMASEGGGSSGARGPCCAKYLQQVMAEAHSLPFATTAMVLKQAEALGVLAGDG